MMTHAPDLMGQALQFRLLHDQPCGQHNPHNAGLAIHLIAEEYDEWWQAHGDSLGNPEDRNLSAECLKELADLVYVCFQYAAASGWELDEALDRVHKSNLSKLVAGKPLKNEVGKVLKGPNYAPPYLEDLVWITKA